MTDDQFNRITKKLMEIGANQVTLEQRLISIQTSLDTVTNRQRTMSYDQEDLAKELQELKELLSK